MRDPYIMIWQVGPLTIWHRDADGVDGACGWTWPVFSDQERKGVESAISWLTRDSNLSFQPVEGLGYVKGGGCLETLLMVARFVSWQIWRSRLTAAQIDSIMAVSSPECEGLGYRWAEPRDKRDIEGLIWAVARILKRDRRQWWQHPRWHVWHWRFHLRAFGRVYGDIG